MMLTLDLRSEKRRVRVQYYTGESDLRLTLPQIIPTRCKVGVHPLQLSGITELPLLEQSHSS